MKPQRRRKHKYQSLLGISWELFHLNKWAYVFRGMAIHFSAMVRFPQLHPHDCHFCRELGIWFRI